MLFIFHQGRQFDDCLHQTTEYYNLAKNENDQHVQDGGWGWNYDG